MHDYFDILGVARNARAQEIRRACARHQPRPHPDFMAVDGRAIVEASDHACAISAAALVDVAIDFPDCASIRDRMQAAFFRPASGGN